MEIASVKQKKALLSEESHCCVPAEPLQLTWESQDITQPLKWEFVWKDRSLFLRERLKHWKCGNVSPQMKCDGLSKAGSSSQGPA